MSNAFTVVVKSNKLPKLLAALDKLQDDLADRVADKAVGHIQARVPVRTGKLRDSYHKEGTESGKRVVTNTEDAYYGLFVELGTRYMPAQPHVIPAALDTTDDVGAIFQELVSAAVG